MGIEPTRSLSPDPSLVLKTRAGHQPGTRSPSAPASRQGCHDYRRRDPLSFKSAAPYRGLYARFVDGARDYDDAQKHDESDLPGHILASMDDVTNYRRLDVEANDRPTFARPPMPLSGPAEAMACASVVTQRRPGSPIIQGDIRAVWPDGDQSRLRRASRDRPLRIDSPSVLGPPVAPRFGRRLKYRRRRRPARSGCL